MKVAPLLRAFQRYPHIITKLVHTGQHFDKQMSTVFFEQLELPKPDYHLGVGPGSPTQQTAQTMLAFEAAVETEQPDLVVVVGDVTATLACALVAVKMAIPVAHVEAGLRSGDRQMPEEINRIVIDSISDLLFVTEKSAIRNLQNEGVSSDKTHFSGNCMIDSLLFYREKIARLELLPVLGLKPKQYLLVTMHRPSNVDTKAGLETVLTLLEKLSRLQVVVCPLHPRTRQKLEHFGLMPRLEHMQSLVLLEPQGYFEFQHLLLHATAVLTDSGGLQEEATFLQVPCITFRETTERPVTVELGTNLLLSSLDPDLAAANVLQVLQGAWKQGKVPDLWDGKAAERIAAVIEQQFFNR